MTEQPELLPRVPALADCLRQRNLLVRQQDGTERVLTAAEWQSRSAGRQEQLRILRQLAGLDPQDPTRPGLNPLPAAQQVAGTALAAASTSGLPRASGPRTPGNERLRVPATTGRGNGGPERQR